MSCDCTASDMTNMVPLDSLLRHIVPFVPKVPHAMGLDLLRQAYIRFALDTSILVQEIQITLQAGVKDYSLDVADGYELYQIKHIDYGCRDRYDYWQEYFVFGRHRYQVVDNCRIILHDTPSQDEQAGLRVWAILTPSECVSTMPVSLSAPFGRGIAAGALADLLMIPDKPWTDLGVAGRFEAMYNRTLQKARNLADSNRQAGPLKMKPVRVV